MQDGSAPIESAPDMKTLYLLRHAKSAWDNPGLQDHDRPLAPRGVKACALMGQHLGNRGVRPDIVICSTATRAQMTLQRVRPYIRPLPKVIDDRRAYMADPEDMLHLLAELDESMPDSQSAMIVGHNPGMYMLANTLSRNGDPAELGRLRHKYPTCAFAEITSEANDWSSFRRARCTLQHYRTPRHLIYLS
ncbi:MAG: histidine phosphatase family protein [Alphaproteobacteria bacterium]